MSGSGLGSGFTLGVSQLGVTPPPASGDGSAGLGSGFTLGVTPLGVTPLGADSAGPAIAALLPSNATPFEAAAEATGAVRAAAIDPGIVKTTIEPYAIPAPLLPWLAWALGVELWSSDWPLAVRRWVVATEIHRKRLKGTLAGLTAYLGLVDTTVVAAIVPPATTYLSPTMTPAARAAWLALFPQLRVLPYVASAVSLYGSFCGAAYNLPGAFLGRVYPGQSTAHDRYTITAELVEPNGATTALTSRVVTQVPVGGGVATDYHQVSLPAVPSTQIFPGQSPKARTFFGKPFDPSSVVAVPIETNYVWSEPQVTDRTVSPGLTPIEAIPDAIAQPHTRAFGQLFAGRHLAAAFLPPSIAWRFIYQRWWLFDPSVAPPLRKASTFLGWTRLGMPPYTAELQVDIAGKVGAREAWGFVSGCLRSPMQTAGQISDARTAVQVGMSVRDTIYLKTRTIRPVQPRDGAFVGGATVGGWTANPP